MDISSALRCKVLPARELSVLLKSGTDYAIITRLTKRYGDAPLLCVAGMGQYGTLAAADFICSPAAISEMTHHLPRDWATKNLQVILHVKVVDFRAAATEVVAAHTW